MFAAFAEAIRATTQPCTLLLLLPALVTTVITRGRWLPFVAICIGAVLGGWLFIANVVALSDVQLQLSGLLVGGAIVVVVAAPTVPSLRWAATPVAQTATAGVIMFVATLWWRPCIGAELGSILTGARRGLWGQLPGMAAYMLGALVPVLAVVLGMRAIDASPVSVRRAGWVAGGVGVVVAGALAVGRHDALVTTLTRWTTS
jgi:VIT1/CCC1 family predicted Fe2+/Mn2+ transporter